MRTTLTFCTLWLLMATLSLAQTSSKRFQEHAKHQPTSHSNAVGKIATHEEYPLLYHNFDWNDSLSQWDSTGRGTFTYFPDGLRAEFIYETSNGSGFTPSYRATYGYNAQGLENVSTTYDWNGSSWDNSYRNETSYDAFGNNSLMMEFMWNGTSWDSSFGERLTYNYVLTDKISHTVGEVWTTNTHLWENSYMEDYTWPNAQGWDTATFSAWNMGAWEYNDRYVDVTWHDFSKFFPLTARGQGFNGTGWDDYERFAVTYGQYDSYVWIGEDWSGNSWDSSYKDVVVFDSHDHDIQYESYSWSGSWALSFGNLSNYTYDLQGNTQEIVNQSTYTGPYVNDNKQVFSSFFTGATDPVVPVTQVQAYPNPCTDRLYFKLDLKQNGPVEVALFDLQGRLRVKTMSATTVGAEITMPISEILENGTYMYRIQTKEGTATGKVAVQR